MTTPGRAQLSDLLPSVVAVMCAVVLFAWAGTVLSNIWGYNDSGAGTYTVVASMLALPGVGLVGLAVVLARRGPHSLLGRALWIAALLVVLAAMLFTSGFLPGLVSDPGPTR